MNTIRIYPYSFSDVFHRIKIYIPSNFSVESTVTYAFPKRSHLFITHKTNLSESCKSYFGEKSVVVHYDNTTEIEDSKTIEVLDYISNPQSDQETNDDFIYHQIKCLQLVSLIPVFNKHRA